MGRTLYMLTKILTTIILCFIIVAMCFFSMISPYEDWDETKTCVDEDALDALKIIWIFAVSVNASFAFFSKFYKKSFIILTFLSLIKIISLFFV